MQTQNLIPGTPEWMAHRSQHWNASDAPAVLDCSPYKSRAQLLREKATGISPEVDAGTQRRFDNGHFYESLARPLAEEIIGDALAPVIGVLEGTKLSASFDGLTLMGDTAWEHKTINADLRACMKDQGNGYGLPKHYRVQLEQQLLVSGAERVLFMASEWTGDGVLVEERHCWYASDPTLRSELLAGWAQFEKDLAAYVPPAAEAPKPTGRSPETLPALRIEITGAVTASNLAEFKETALGAIRSVNRDLTTDAHFADAEQAVKWCGEVESRIKAAKEHALSQTATIEALFRTLDDVSAEARRVRLDLEKLVERRKVEIKGELVAEAKGKYERHVAALRQECGAWRVLTPPDFGSAIKGKRNVASIRDALETTLAQAKIEADESARTIRAALAALDEESKGFEHLFSDRLTFIGMIPEAVRLMVRDRIAKHREAEERRAAELAERERERIRAEEAARLQREQEAREAEQRRLRAAEEAQRQEALALERRLREEAAAREHRERLPAVAPAATVHQLPPRQSPPVAPPSMKLGDINARIAPLSITSEGLRQLGFEPAGRERAAVLYHDADLPRIIHAAIQHLAKARDQMAKVA